MKRDRDGIPGRQYAPLRPDRREHRLILSQKVKSFKEERKIYYAGIADGVWEYLKAEENENIAEPWKEPYLRKFVSDPVTLKPSGHQMNVMYRYLDEQGAWDQRAANRDQVSQIGHSLYYSLLEFFDVAEMTTTNLLRRLPGIYRIYRPVLTHPGYFVVGVVWIWSDEALGVLFFQEYDYMQKLRGREPKHLTLEGYAFKKSNFVSLFASDSSKSSIHITTFTSCEIQDDEYIILFGGFFDTLGKQMYSGKVFMERVQGVEVDEDSFRKLKSESICISEDELPPSIKGFFQRPGESEDIGLF